MRSVLLDRLTFVKREEQRAARRARMKGDRMPVLDTLGELD